MVRRSGIVAAVAMVACLVLLGCDGGSQAPVVEVPKTPDGTVKAVADALADGKPQVLWSAMPASYQKDVTGLVHDFATKMDAEVYNKGVTLAKKLVQVLREKKDFILANPMLAQAKVNVDEAKKHWDTVVGMLDTVVNSELSSLDSLKTVDVGKFLGSTGAKLMAQAAAVSKLSADDPYQKQFVSKLKGLKVEVVSSAEDKAKVKMTAPGEKAKQEDMVRVEGKWVPQEVAEDWKEAIGEAKANLAKLPEQIAKSKTQIMMMMGGIEPMLDQMLKAKTADEFNQSVGQVLGPMLGGLMGGGPPKPPSKPMPPVPPKPPGGPK